jgi:hypothetical protein
MITPRHIRQKGWLYMDPKPGNLLWDKATGQMHDSLDQPNMQTANLLR